MPVTLSKPTSQLTEARLASESLATLCKAASDPLRLDIMRVLSQDSFGVLELANIFDMPQPGMSHHLKVLATAGLLVTRRQGNSIFYRRPLMTTAHPLDAFQHSLFATIDNLPLSPDYKTRIDGIYQERSAQSRLYFERNADKFAEHQMLLCELSQYLPNLLELVDLMQLGKKSRLLEIGPGEGQLLAELSSRFTDLFALDNSGKMLALAQEKLAKEKRAITFIQSSLEAFSPGAERFDAVVLNMSLHHMASPRNALQKSADFLRPGGYLLLADLCEHDQEWTQTSCGDVWLGFDPVELTRWAGEAGFTEQQGLYLGLKNGFQIQLRLFQHC